MVDVKKLFKAACDVQKKSHSPYSKFRVGAALSSASKVFTGTNVENASYGATICAERAAVLKAVSEGVKKFDRLVLIADSKQPVVPCGMCLQVLTEFCPADMEVWSAGKSEKKPHLLGQLKDFLPNAFNKGFF